jgi:hypothetical protein
VFYTKAFNGDLSSFTRYIQVELRHTSGLSFPNVKMFISPLSFDIILGKPWHTRFNPQINWANNTITFGEITFPAGKPMDPETNTLISAKEYEKILRNNPDNCFTVHRTITCYRFLQLLIILLRNRF